jgi:mannose-6-phosphate isomerase-like protein (cupin superfamily)
MQEILTPAKFADPVDEDGVAADWAARGYSCHRFTDPPGQEWRDFVHDTNEVVTVVEGRLKLTVAAESVTAGPGDEVFIPRGAAHTVRNIHGGTTRWLFGYD